MRSLNRFLSTALFLRRRFCTAAALTEAAAEESSPLPPPPPSSSSSSSKKNSNSDSLYRQLSRLPATGGKSVSETLNEFIRDGRVPRKDYLDSCIKELRKYSQFQKSLEIMDWMKMRGMNFSHKDHAIYLHLLSKTKGVSAAENYFHGLSPFNQNLNTCGALLHCYCQQGLEDKALAHFKRMEEMNVASTNLAYNGLMSLNMKLGKPKNVAPLAEEMKQKNISLSALTYGILIHSYSCLDDMAGVERVMEEVKKDDEMKQNWIIYSNLANAYVKAGDFEKAELALKELEKVMSRSDQEAYHLLLSVYATTSNIAEVKRIWGELKSACSVTRNINYLAILQALSRVGDLVGFKDIFTEWEGECSFYDVRLANVAVKTYLKADMVEEAELVFERALKRSLGPFFKAREMFMSFFLEKQKIDSAMMYMEAAIDEVKDGEWHPSPEIVSKFFEYFNKKMAIDRAEEFFELLKRVGSCNSTACNLLVQTYITAGKTVPDIRGKLEDHGIEMNNELENLLVSV
ncbi:Pentatricopeptide repeat [Dillenia turbinata]|uniref:Pentatricopeptide repeat n=1 Tax=Dillenia turbinata TaxID=194707 RepID=A0AAN8VWX2_9MAGN